MTDNPNIIPRELKIGDTVRWITDDPDSCWYGCFGTVTEVRPNEWSSAGNAHNYLFDYDWEMTPRDTSKRNNPGTTYTQEKL